ncbi:hypothetical protein ABEB36_001478 [Hypothenemus hampei]|uniref:MSP domain-containing protein n=1 Tax=Hypothenemus hampei TaxID=57062 RepID=A0ABD1FEQ5_HYPHA
MSLNLHQIPVFAFPSSLKFFLGTKSTHTQVLTLYSPYNFPVKYKVHCHSSAWDKYIVPNPEGTIPGQSSVDLVITHKQLITSNCNVPDKLKILIQDPVTEQIIGGKLVEAVLLNGERDNRSHTDEDFDFHSQEGSTRLVQSGRTLQRIPPNLQTTTTNHLVSSLIVAICAIILFLPTEAEAPKPTNLPSYLQVSHKIQLLASLLLGVFLCILVRT